MRSLLILLIATLTLVTFAPRAAVVDAAGSVRALQSEREGPDGIAIRENICTVTSINAGKHFWLTAAHCLEDPNLYIADYPAAVVFMDDKADLAILYTVDYAAPALALRSSPPTVGLPVTIFGYPLGFTQRQRFSGSVSALHTEVNQADFILFDMTVCNGDSGSAVVDDRGRVVSVTQIGLGMFCSPFSGGAPWEVVRDLVGPYFGS